MVKAIFFDLDGTLLTTEKRIPQSVKEAICRCREKGLKIFVATARPPLLKRMLNLSLEEAELLSDGGVFYNGGCICYGQIKAYQPVSYDVFKEALKVVAGFQSINFAIQMAEEKHSFLYDLPSDQYQLWGIDNSFILPFEHPWDYSIVKMLVFRWEEPIVPIYNRLKEHLCGRANVYLTGKGTSIEITNKEISKKSAIESILNSFNLRYDETAVFGDDYNDLEMLRTFPHSVAMGNADETVKRAAKYVTMSNDDDGICYALKNYLHLF